MARQGNRPNRRVARCDLLSLREREALADRLVYEGSALHKRFPGDYGFVPPVNPRAAKSLCDGVRQVLLEEARLLFRNGILKGMFSKFEGNGRPKYVWSVDEQREVYEAIAGRDGYHGYRLEDEDDMRHLVLREWNTR